MNSSPQGSLGRSQEGPEDQMDQEEHEDRMDHEGPEDQMDQKDHEHQDFL